MTSPDERRRNLIWGREMLQELSEDAHLQDNWRTEAAGLLVTYPSLAFLQHFDADEPSELDGFVGVLIQACTLLQGVRGSASCSDERRNSLHVVLRHFY